jgi:hypothetical protein
VGAGFAGAAALAGGFAAFVAARSKNSYCADKHYEREKSTNNSLFHSFLLFVLTVLFLASGQGCEV